jgi:superfamily II DNA or RNA helicase
MFVKKSKEEKKNMTEDELKEYNRQLKLERNRLYYEKNSKILCEKAKEKNKSLTIEKKAKIQKRKNEYNKKKYNEDENFREKQKTLVYSNNQKKHLLYNKLKEFFIIENGNVKFREGIKPLWVS